MCKLYWSTDLTKFTHAYDSEEEDRDFFFEKEEHICYGPGIAKWAT